MITLAVSLGGVESLIEHPASITHRGLPEDEQRRQGITSGLVRLSAGCEDLDDLLTDLAQRSPTLQRRREIAMTGTIVHIGADPSKDS